MTGKFTQIESLKWTSVILNPDNELINDISLNWIKYRKIFIDKIAGNLYEDLRRARVNFATPFTFNKDFNKLTIDEKRIWYDYASAIPEKLRSLNLSIRPYRDFCRTCILTDEEIEKLAILDHEIFSSKPSPRGKRSGKTTNIKKQNSPVQATFKDLPGTRKWFFKELNYLIPLQLKKIGYEIIRSEEAGEIDITLIKKLARALHSRYLHKMRSQGTDAENDLNVSMFNYNGDGGNQYPADFENLPEEVILSNTDNAYHIPTKLLSIGYKIRPVQKGFKPVTLHLNDDEVETMARLEHIRWSWDKRLNGWIYGSIKDNTNKIHSDLLPYEDLSEFEKEKDREFVRLIPALLQDIKYEVYPINPGRIKKLSYAIKPASSINKILQETRGLNDQIRKLVSLTPEVENMVRVRNLKVEEAIREVAGSYDYAQHIQEAYLPDDLYVTECFSKSFVLFKPKDIVSGDFYFFSKMHDSVIFAAADCTGHGIPGALLSIIGYGILDQAVNELKLTDLKLILSHLYSRVHRFLRREEGGTGLSDDMDIILCSLDLKTSTLNYSGVGRPLYHVRKGELIEYKPQISRDDCSDNGEYPFASQRIHMKTGDTIYLFSDGYIDQFGGKNHKKYQSSRFRNFLLNIQGHSMPEQSDRLYEEIENWREENNEDQTDDILVIGVRM